MGFTVTEEVTFPQYGVTAANCYVTIKASYTHVKVGAPNFGVYMPTIQPTNYPNGSYTLTARFYVYTANNPELSPLRETTIFVNAETASEDPIATLYTYIKSEYFAGKTCTDDL